MWIATCEVAGKRSLAIVRGERLLPVEAKEYGGDDQGGVLEVILAGAAVLERIRGLCDQAAGHEWLPLDQVVLLAPIPRPRKNIICVGWNYAEHAQESMAVQKKEATLPEHPVVFTKAVTSVNGPFAHIPLHSGVTAQLDWEVELAVVMGRGGKDISERDALNHVFGYTVINDVSARDLQFRHKQYYLGKSLDGACPMGPWIVTADEIDDVQNLEIRSWVNGQLMQSSNTCHMIFSVARLIATLSAGITLEAGDIIATGTPAGVGFARQPPVFLQAGDRVECEVAGIGRLINQVR